MQETVTPLYPTPPKEIEVSIGGEQRVITMSYGLQDQLLRLVKDTNQIGEIFTDAQVRNGVIEQILAERSVSGKVVGQLRSFDDYEISLEDVDKVLNWAVDVVTSFFIRSLNSLNNKMVSAPPPEAPPSETPSTQS